MKGRSTKIGVWETVYRRKNKSFNRKTWENNIVSFFVGNIPDGYGASDLKKVFNKYGDLVDVYMARKRDRSGSNFGFVRFAGVDNVDHFEDSMGKICMGNRVLVTNVSKYQRNAEARQPDQKRNFIPKNNQPNVASTTAWGFRGQKSFANAVRGGNVVSSDKPTSIKLKVSQEIDKMLADAFLIGEVKDSEYLKAISNLLIDEGINFKRVFFYGGLHVLIGFDESSEAIGLLNNSECWNKWFKWIRMGDYTKDVDYQRAADVEVVGLPMQYRTMENMTKILGEMGNVLMIDEDIWKTDSSACFGCILTGSKTLINKEVWVEVDDEKVFSIGIIERNFNLKPFDEEGTWGNNVFHDTKMDDLSKADDDEFDNEDDSDGISESWNNNEWEEGEFRPQVVVDRLDENIPINDVTFPVEDESMDAFNASGIPENNTIVEESVILEPINVPVEVPLGIKSVPNIQIPWASPMMDGPNFGPFCASLPNRSTNSMGLSKGSVSKKRRRFSPTRDVQNNDSSMHSRSNPVISNSSIDLNKQVRSSDANTSCSSGDESNSHSDSSIPEITKTVEVGVDVGFVISENDPVLCNILAGEGTHTGIQ